MPAPILALTMIAVLPWQEMRGLSRAQMRADLRQFSRDVRDKWSYYDDHRLHFEVDLEAWVARETDALAETESLGQFAERLRRIVADLSDGHARLETPGHEPEASFRWPFTLREVHGGVAVERLAGGYEVGAHMEARPRPGDLLRGVDGREIKALWASAQRLTFASTPGMRRALALQRLTRTEARAVSFEFEGADGIRFGVELDTVVPGALKLAFPAEEPWSQRELDRGVVLLRISSFAMPDWRTWLDADQEERDASQVAVKSEIDALFAHMTATEPRALVIDLRGNRGGTDSLGIHFAERLLPDKFTYFRLSALRDGGWSDPQGLTYGTAEGLTRVLVPIVALIDEGCFSTTDNFLRALDVLHPDFTSVGRPTGAGTGAPRVVSELAHSGARITLCTQRVYAPDGSLTEGRGTQPDVLVTWSSKDLSEGRDPDLTAALELLRGRGLLSD